MSPELLFDVLRVSSTIACIILAAYLIRCSDILNKLDLNNNLVVSFAFITLAYAFIKNTAPINEQMEMSAIISQEIFRLIVPLQVTSLCMAFCEVYKFKVNHEENYNGIDRRHGA